LTVDTGVDDVWDGAYRTVPALLEREPEMALLDKAVAESIAGRGRVVLIEGPAGIGKSALLKEASEQAVRRAMRVMSAQGAVLERDFSFGVVRQLLEPLVVQAGPTRRGELLAGAAQLAAPVLSVETSGGASNPAAVVQVSTGWSRTSPRPSR
jgi:ABC-type cobalamin/Fe3+-siderophores transport system ATPase subunit